MDVTLSWLYSNCLCIFCSQSGQRPQERSLVLGLASEIV
jgi:hypothetical protein